MSSFRHYTRLASKPLLSSRKVSQFVYLVLRRASVVLSLRSPCKSQALMCRVRSSDYLPQSPLFLGQLTKSPKCSICHAPKSQISSSSSTPKFIIVDPHFILRRGRCSLLCPSSQFLSRSFHRLELCQCHESKPSYPVLSFKCAILSQVP
jgi:hypothetical protein